MWSKTTASALSIKSAVCNPAKLGVKLGVDIMAGEYIYEPIDFSKFEEQMKPYPAEMLWKIHRLFSSEIPMNNFSFPLYFCTYGIGRIDEVLKGISFRGLKHPFNEKDLRAIFDSLPFGGYGDLVSMETKVDVNVRCAKDLPKEEITLTPECTALLASMWREEKMLPRDVTVEPYKINMYGKGGKFARHVDTPSVGMVGTIVVTILSSDNSSFEFVIDDEKPSAQRGIIGFYGDVPHELKEGGDDDFRVTLTCKVFVKDMLAQNSEQQDWNTRDTNKEHLLKNCISSVLAEKPLLPFGFILSHKYPVDEAATGLKGFDSLLHRVLLSCIGGDSSRIVILPIVNIFHYRHDCTSRPPIIVVKGEVYTFIDEDLAWYMDGCKSAKLKAAAEKSREFLAGISSLLPMPFFQIHVVNNAYVVDDKSQEAGYTGNEVLKAEKNSVYLQRAIIVMPKKQI
jgi:hypothetical protein